jgi:hypothetical protein
MQKIINKVSIFKGSKEVRRIFFIDDNKQYLCIEQVLEQDRFKKIGRDNVWKKIFFFTHENRDIVRTAFIGRFSIIGYEEGNPNE